MPSVKTYLNQELHDRVTELCGKRAFGSLSAALVYLIRLGLDTTLLRPYYDPITTLPMRESLNIDIKDNIKESNAEGVASDPIATPKPLTAAQEKVLDLVEDLTVIILQSSGKSNLNLNPRKCIVTVEQVIRIDGVPHNDVAAAMKWALQDDFWGTLLLSIPQWRKNVSGTPKFWNMWSKWKKVTDPTHNMTTQEYYDQNPHKPKVEKTGHPPPPRGELHGMTDEIREALGITKRKPTVEEHYEQQAEESRAKALDKSQKDGMI